MNEGNYLMFAVANRWVNRLTYVYPTRRPWTANWNSSPFRELHPDPSGNGAPNDLMLMYFRRRDWRTGMLELPHFSRATMERYIMSGRALDDEDVLHREPRVPYDFAALPNFQASKSILGSSIRSVGAAGSPCSAFRFRPRPPPAFHHSRPAR
jgi:hypothetical protein